MAEGLCDDSEFATHSRAPFKRFAQSVTGEYTPDITSTIPSEGPYRLPRRDSEETLVGTEDPGARKRRLEDVIAEGLEKSPGEPRATELGIPLETPSRKRARLSPTSSKGKGREYYVPQSPTTPGPQTSLRPSNVKSEEARAKRRDMIEHAFSPSSMKGTNMKSPSAVSDVPRPSDLPAPSVPTDPGPPGLEPMPVVNKTVKIFSNLEITERLAPHVAWGVLWEVARWIKNHDKGSLTEDVIIKTVLSLNATGESSSHPSNTVAERIYPALDELYLREATDKVIFLNEADLRDPWKELDSEDESLRIGKGDSLGTNTLSAGDAEFKYGGKVEQALTLVLRGEKSCNMEYANVASKYAFKIDRQRLGVSFRLARLLGSKNVIQVGIPKHVQNSPKNQLLEFFQKEFVFFDRKFKAFYAKETTVYLVDVNSTPSGLWGLIQYHNPMIHNQGQGMAKYSARFALIFSTSIPVAQIAVENIMIIDDIEGAWSGSDKVPPEQCFTDGCGFMNRAAACLIQKALNLDYLPFAAQARMFGAKGMFLLKTDDTSEEPRVWIRKSQQKIKYPNFSELSPVEQRSHLTFDILRTPHPAPKGIRLSKEVIICLVEHGVPFEMINEIFEKGLREEVRWILDWHTLQSEIFLYDWLSKRAMSSRLRTMVAAIGRAYFGGYKNAADDPDDGDDEDDIEDQHSVAWYPDLNSGQPSSLEETIMALLCAGFTTQNCSLAREKLSKVLDSVVKSYTKGFRCPVSLATSGFAIPDPTGTLKEGEVFFQASNGLAGSDTSNVLTGPVLATRHPVKVISDIRKFIAVDRSELRTFNDIIIFSTQGIRSPLSWLAGGDYDGDTVILMWDPRLLEHFKDRNPNRCAADPPKDFIKKNFIKEETTVAEFLKNVKGKTDEEKEKHAQQFLLAPLSSESHVGQYSKLHENLTYLKGYCHPDTERAAHMFCTTLDSTKSGLTVRPEVLSRDLARMNSSNLSWDEPKRRLGGFQNGAPPPVRLRRPHHLGDHILESLHETGINLKKELTQKYRDQAKPYESDDRARDLDLLAPYKDYLSRLEIQKVQNEAVYVVMKRQLEALEDVVRKHVKEHQRKVEGLTKRKITDRQDILRQSSASLKKQLSQLPWISSQKDLSQLCASYAYKLDMDLHGNRGTRYPWDVQFRELCTIKSEASGTSYSVRQKFFESFVIHKGALRVFASQSQASTQSSV